MQNFTSAIATKIFFGKGSISNIGPEIKKYSSNILIAYGSERIKGSGLFDQVAKELTEHGIKYREVSGIKANPTITSVHRGIDIMNQHQLDFVLAVGGGSVIDAAKAMAAGAAMDLDPWILCKREATVEKAFPLASILTLAATGSEMNGGSVISNEATNQKLFFGSDLTRPVFSVLDPTLTFTVPKNQTAAGVADIFTHVAEQYFDSINTAGISDRLSEGIMKTCIQYGRTAIDDPENYDARANLMWAGTMALNGIISYGKNGGDWATHMIEHEVSAAYDITHGLGLAIILPQWMTFVLADENLDRFTMFAESVWNIKLDDPWQQAKAGIQATTAFFQSLDIPARFSEIGIEESSYAHMAKQGTHFGELGSFRKLNQDDVLEILKMAH